MSVEIRNPSEDELRKAMKAVEAAFGEEQKEEDLDRHQKAMPRDRFFVAYDGAVPVGTTASLPFELTVPGSELATGGVTWVGVLPSHRRRGILTQMMKHQLDDLHVRLSTELAESATSIPVAMEMGLVARFFERLGDHAVNVTRRVRYLVPVSADPS